MSEFLDKPLTAEQLDQLADHLHVDNFRRNEAVNGEHLKAIGMFNAGGHFVRKGITGDWKNHFSRQLNERVDRWIEANLAASDLKFITELDD